MADARLNWRMRAIDVAGTDVARQGIGVGLVVGLLLATSLALTACSRQPAALRQTYAEDVTGAECGQDFVLTDMFGHPRTLADYRGKVVVLFFGYTHCPEVCPTTLYDLSQAMQRLGVLSNQIQVLFVTLDPERDTPKVLSQFVPAFGRTFIGLYAAPSRTAGLASRFHVYFHKQPMDSQGNYAIDHSAFSYVFDREGRLRLKMPYGESPDSMAHDLREVLSSR